MTVTIRTTDGQTFQASGDQADAVMLMLEIGKGDILKVQQGKMVHWVFRAHIASVTIWEG